jgi:hypothetical protein
MAERMHVSILISVGQPSHVPANVVGNLGLASRRYQLPMRHDADVGEGRDACDHGGSIRTNADATSRWSCGPARHCHGK